MVLLLLTCLVLRLRHCGQELCGHWDPHPPVVIECLVLSAVIPANCLQLVINDRHFNKKVLGSARVCELSAQGVQSATEQRAISDPAPIRRLRQRYILAS